VHHIFINIIDYTQGDIMIIQWDESLSVHNSTIDDQHKQFIKLINDLDEVTAGRGDITSNVLRAIKFLEDYAQKHFAYEESYFISHDFPESAEHIEFHRAFMRTIADMRKELDMAGANMKLANDISKFTADWLIMHVRGTDHRYEVFIETGKLPPKHNIHHFK
jgi:hemerythrin-like metal-binding protein